MVWATVGSRTLERSWGETSVMGVTIWTPASLVLEPARIISSQPVLGHGLALATTVSPQLLGRMKG